MKVILLENLRKLGSIGDIIDVKRGFARNFLISKKKALFASKENIEIVNNRKEQLNKKDLTLKKEARKSFEILNNKNYKIQKLVTENNDLYGSVKPTEISKIIKEKDNIDVKPSQIDLGKEINKIGSYEAKINLHAEIQALIHIQVAKEEEKN